MSFFDARAARVLATIIVFALGIAFVSMAWRTLVTFLFAILFAYLLEPVVGAAQQRFRLSRGRAIFVVYLVLLGLLAGFLLYMGPRIVQQVARLAMLAPGVSAGVANGQIAHQVGNQRGWSYATQMHVQQFLVQHRAQISQWQKSVLSEVAGLATNLGWAVLIPILAIFFLLSGARYFQTVLEQLERRRQRAFVGGLLQDVHDVLASYIRAQIALTALAIVVYVVGLELLRLQYAIAVGVVAGALEFIPVVGPLLAAALVLGVGFISGYGQIWALLIFLGAWRVLQDYYNSPHIMGGQVQLDPLAVLFGVFAGAEIAGVIGVYLSIPVLASLRVIWIRWRTFEGGAHLVTAPGEAPPPAASSGQNRAA